MSTLVVSNINDGTTTVPATYATNGSAKSLLRYEQYLAVGILNSFNVSSVTDQATGNWYQNLTSSLANDNFMGAGVGREVNSNSSINLLGCDYDGSSTSQVRWWNVQEDAGAEDNENSCCVFGDLA